MPSTRTSDPETSHEAEKSVRNVTLTQEMIIKVLEDLTYASDTSIRAEFIRRGWFQFTSESGLRSRRAELVKLGKVRHNGLYTFMPSVRRTRLWVLA